jgi:imidazolonepropionase-like amidohydrolase
LSNFTDAEINAIGDETIRSRKNFAAHAMTRDGIIQAVNAGARSIEHGLGMDEESMKLMASKGVFWCPTLFVNEFVAAAHNLQHMPGIFNLTQPGYLTTKQVVEMLIKHNLTTNKLYFKNIEDFEKTVATPRSNCVLDSSLAIRAGINLTPIADAMQLAIDEYAFNLKQHA